MNIEDIRLFTEVVVHQGISEAARRLPLGVKKAPLPGVACPFTLNHSFFVCPHSLCVWPYRPVVTRVLSMGSSTKTCCF